MKKDQYLLKDFNNIHSVCEKAIYTFGSEHQKIKAMEELGELIQAISRSILGQDHNVEEELADVYVMLNQLLMMFDSEKVDQFIYEKLERLKGYVW